MAQFIIRNLEDDIHHKLRGLAQSRGQNLEEFVREVLRGVVLQNLTPRAQLGSRIAARFASCGLTDDETIPELKGETIEPLGFQQ